MVPPAQMFKNRLQEYVQKKSLPLPFYHTVNDGTDHLSQFKCTVTINGTKYESPPGFSHTKAAQNAAAEEAVENLQRQGFKFKERKRPKCVLAELSSMKNIPPPTYHFIKSVTATVENNGVSYTGAPAKNLKEAANKAAFEAIWAIDPHYCIALSHVELNASNDSEKPTGEPHASKSESKIPADNWASTHQLLGGSETQSAEEIQGKQQSSQEVDLTDSISKRNKIESENAEYMSQRTKKHKWKKRNGTAIHKRE